MRFGPRARRKIRCPIDLEWSRGLAVVKQNAIFLFLQTTMFSFYYNEACARCPDRDAAPVFVVFVFVVFVFCAGGGPQ